MMDEISNRIPKVFLSRKNLEVLLSKLDRKKSGEDTACAIVKRDTTHEKYPQTMQEILVTAVENEDYYSSRRAGEMHPRDEAAISKFKEGDWVVATEKEKLGRVEKIDPDSNRSFLVSGQWYLPSELRKATELDFPKPDFEAPIRVEEDQLFGAGFYFGWQQKTVGFGQCSISIDKDGNVHADLEGMGIEWTKRALYSAVDTLIEMAKKQNIK